MLKAKLPFQNLQLGACWRAGNCPHLGNAEWTWLIDIQRLLGAAPSICNRTAACHSQSLLQGVPSGLLRCTNSKRRSLSLEGRTCFNWGWGRACQCAQKRCLAKGASLQAISGYQFSHMCLCTWKFSLQISLFSLFLFEAHLFWASLNVEGVSSALDNLELN